MNKINLLIYSAINQLVILIIYGIVMDFLNIFIG